jgi:hypothetical protein
VGPGRSKPLIQHLTEHWRNCKSKFYTTIRKIKAVYIFYFISSGYIIQIKKSGKQDHGHLSDRGNKGSDIRIFLPGKPQREKN